MDLSFDDEREMLQAKRKELMDAVVIIDSAIETLAKGGAGGFQTRLRKTALQVEVGVNGVRAGRRPMSAKNRKAARARMNAYWASPAGKARRKAAAAKAK